MKARINFKWIVVVTTVVVFAAYGAASKISWAKGGGHGGGGHGGEHHEGEHHEATMRSIMKGNIITKSRIIRFNQRRNT